MNIDNRTVRVRFAPSPTGALHIGGIRTALYNYLLAKKQGGIFILRIEDTDQGRYVAGAEQYILNSLKWCGIEPTEGPTYGGNFGPYRQSERKEMYGKYAQELVEKGLAYVAYDTVEELEKMRQEYSSESNPSPMYNHITRKGMKNSLTMTAEENEMERQKGTPFVIRMRIDPGMEIAFDDAIRENVVFRSEELDDKILVKADGMPTYHFANVVDDHLMEISHVIRGEEWLSSTAHHVLLYKYFGWEETMPVFAHLPLILKPEGSGKLSKRDGAKFGFPVFPLEWDPKDGTEAFAGFKESGFDPRAVVNFLALLGWSPGDDRELMDLEEMVEAFSLEKVGKSGARFDFEKAKWFNQQYIKKTSGEDLAGIIRSMVPIEYSDEYVASACNSMKERVFTYNELFTDAKFFYSDDFEIDEAMVDKKWSPKSEGQISLLKEYFKDNHFEDSKDAEERTKAFLQENGIGMGEIFPILRLALTGTLKGPDLFQTITILGKPKVIERLEKLLLRMKSS